MHCAQHVIAKFPKFQNRVWTASGAPFGRYTPTTDFHRIQVHQTVRRSVKHQLGSRWCGCKTRSRQPLPFAHLSLSKALNIRDENRDHILRPKRSPTRRTKPWLNEKTIGFAPGTSLAGEHVSWSSLPRATAEIWNSLSFGHSKSGQTTSLKAKTGRESFQKTKNILYGLQLWLRAKNRSLKIE